MSVRRHLTFANIASATALVVALGGGGAAMAATLAKNSVGSAQLQKGAVKKSDLAKNAVTAKAVKDDSLTGADVNESTLAGVASAVKATTADSATKATTVDTISTKKVTAAVGQSATVATKGPLSLILRCTDNGGGSVAFELVVTTSADNAAFDANVSGSDDDDLDVADGDGSIADGSGTGPSFEQAGFAALTPAGDSWQGYGLAGSKLGGSAGCLAQMTFIG